MNIKLRNPKEIFKSRYGIVWFALFVIAFISITMMITSTFMDKPANKVRTAGEEHVILWFYFTFQSNFIALITSTIITFFQVDREKPWVQRLKICMSINLTVTLIVFWTILFHGYNEYTPFSFITTLMIHGVNPTMAVAAFCYDALVEKYKTTVTKRTTSLLVLYPVIWMIVAIIVYYSYGSEAGAIYDFLAFNERAAEGKTWLPICATVGIGVWYVSFNLLYTSLLEKHSWKIFKK